MTCGDLNGKQVEKVRICIYLQLIQCMDRQTDNVWIDCVDHNKLEDS